jgi:hypothetical protein
MFLQEFSVLSAGDQRIMLVPIDGINEAKLGMQGSLLKLR